MFVNETLKERKKLHIKTLSQTKQGNEPLTTRLWKIFSDNETENRSENRLRQRTYLCRVHVSLHVSRTPTVNGCRQGLQLHRQLSTATKNEDDE